MAYLLPIYNSIPELFRPATKKGLTRRPVRPLRISPLARECRAPWPGRAPGLRSYLPDRLRSADVPVPPKYPGSTSCISPRTVSQTTKTWLSITNSKGGSPDRGAVRQTSLIPYRPVRMEPTVPVSAAVGVGAEQVALRLGQRGP